MENYRLVKETKSETKTESFIIEEKKFFLWWSWWTVAKYYDDDMRYNSHTVAITEFKKLTESTKREILKET